MLIFLSPFYCLLKLYCISLSAVYFISIHPAFIKLADAKAYADCDVDAPNLHLITGWSVEPEKTDYYGLQKAEINQELCTQCDQCRQNCRFDAISIDEKYKVDPFACEGCGVCEYVCPVEAITMKPAVAGELMLYSDGEKAFSTAQLKMGSVHLECLSLRLKNK